MAAEDAKAWSRRVGHQWDAVLMSVVLTLIAMASLHCSNRLRVEATLWKHLYQTPNRDMAMRSMWRIPETTFSGRVLITCGLPTTPQNAFGPTPPKAIRECCVPTAKLVVVGALR